MSSMDFPPRDDKKKVLRSFDGLDEALSIKRAGESVDGSGVSHEGNQEAVLDALARFEQSWGQADARHAAFMEAGIGGWSAFSTYMDERQSEIEAISDLAKADPALSAALSPLLVSVDKSFGKFRKAGTSMMGQGILEQPKFFTNISDGVKVLVDTAPQSSNKTERDRSRQKRGGKSSTAPDAENAEKAPAGLYGKGNRAAQMQADIDAGLTFEEQRIASRKAISDYVPSTPADGLTLAEQAAAAKASLKDLKPSTETDGPTLAEQGARARASLKDLEPSTEADDPTLAEQTDAVRKNANEQVLKVGADSVDAAQNAPLPADATLGEVRGRLRSLREKITGLEAPEGAQPLSASELYELRVGSFASKNGLTDTLDAVRGARSAYFEALVQHRARGYSEDKEEGGLGDLKAAYDRSLYWWKSTLEHKATELSGREQSEALIIAKRDTILGPANLDVEARTAALNEKGKTAFGKAEIWLARSPQTLLKLVNLPFNLLGKGAATLLHGKEEKLTQAEYANRYARASRILAGAGFATAVALAATPVAATTALLTFMVYGARGTIGTVAGVGAAKVAGGIFSRFFSTKKREALKEHLSKTPTSLEEYQEQQEAYKRGHTGKRQQEKMAWQMLAAMVAGSGTGLLTSPLAQGTLEHFGALKGVKDAADTVAEVNANSPEAAASALKVSAAAKEATEASAASPAGAGSAADTAEGAPAVVAPAEVVPVAPAPGEAVPAVPAHPTTPEGLLVGATIHTPGEGFGEMIQEFKHNFHEQLSVIDAPSPALAHVLNTNPNALTDQLGVAESGQSLTMQPGDQLVADENQNIWFQPKGGEPQLVFENDPTAPGGFRTHEIHGHMQTDIVHHEAPVVSSSAPESSSVSIEPGGIAAADGSTTLSTDPGVTIQSGTEVISENGVDVTQGSSISVEAPAAAPEVAPAPKAPEVPPAAPAVPAPEQAPATPAPAVPEAAPVQAPPPEQVPVPAAAPEAVSTGPHPFASPDAPPLLNENGVDLNKPQVLMNEGRWFAHGTNVDDSYERAVAQSQALAKAGEPNSVYFVVPETDVTGRETLAVRMVFTPPDGSAPQMAPFGEGLQTGAQFTMPPVPKDADYQLPPRR
jgi:hypothetical protein